MNDNSRFIQLIYRRCFLSSMLAILGSVIGQIVNAVIIGRVLGPEELSVISITLPVYYAYTTIGALLGVGGTAVCARLIGESRFDECRRAFTAAYALTVILAAALSAVLLLFSARIAGFMGVTPDMAIYPNVLAYMRILSAGGVGIMSIYPAFNLLRLDGRNRATAVVFLVMAAVNILLSLILVLGLETGVAGAAASTVLGSGTAGLLGGALLFTKGHNFRFKWRRGKDEAAFSRLAADIIVSGSPSALENLCILTRTVVLNWIFTAMLHSMVSLSAFKVTDSVNSFAQIFIAGASGAMMPFIGVFGSEKDTSSIRQLLRLAFLWGGVLTAAFTAVCVLFAEDFAGLFGMKENMAAALPAIRIFALSLPFALCNKNLVSLYQAERNMAAANILTAGRSLVWVTAAAFLLTPGLNADGVWHSFWIAETLALGGAMLVSAVYRKKNRYLSKLFLLDTEAEAKGTYKSFSVQDSLEAISESVTGISGFCEENRLNPKRAMAISLATEEMLVLIHDHCFSGRANQTANVRVLIWDDTVILRVRNGGKKFNPIDYYERKRSDNLDAKAENKLDRLDLLADSLGIAMILELAESVDYRSTFGVNNVTIIIE